MAMSQSQYERMRDENINNNKLIMEQLFGSSTPAADMRTEMKSLHFQQDGASPKTRHDHKRYFTNNEVDTRQRLDKLEAKRKAKLDPAKPTIRYRYVLDHVLVSRQSSCTLTVLSSHPSTLGK
ncbi:hypothetical protein FBU30_008432 [Linnemannia zychae]|nr:hypothetical protein FBU30_008432 [Linnemannia zychae]